MTDDRCLNSVGGISSFPALPLLLSLSLIFFISFGEKNTLFNLSTGLVTIVTVGLLKMTPLSSTKTAKIFV